jgi:tetratricopeptide (TPR) repeat protein
VTLPQPYTLPARNTDVFRIFVISLPAGSTRFVRGLEFRPGNPVVHHANILVDRTPTSRALDQQDPEPGYEGAVALSVAYPDGHFLSWTPGQTATMLPKGLAWRLDPGTDLVVELHMQPSGRPEVVQPTIGLFFGADPPERTPTMLRLARQSIDIPAGEKAYTVTDSYVVPVDVEVQAVQPHAHYRARDVRGLATLPDGSTRWLIYIKDWDFRWQHVYRYVTPIVLPKGTTLAMRYTYDNSAENVRNPQQPPKRVLWGQRTSDEMADLWIQVLTRDEAARATLSQDFRRKEIGEDVVGYESVIRSDPRNVGLHDQVAQLYLELARLPEATAHFAVSVELRPDSAAAHFNLGTALSISGRLEEAIGQYRQALQIRPDYARARNNLGGALLRLGNLDEALQNFREALRLDPANGEAHYNVASVLHSRGNLVEAVREFQAAVHLSPESTPAITSLAWLLATAPDAALRDANQAIRFAERAVSLTGRRDANALDVLGAAYAAAGQFDRAVAASEEALGLKVDEPLAGAVRRRQQLYKQRKPYLSPVTSPQI